MTNRALSPIDALSRAERRRWRRLDRQVRRAHESEQLVLLGKLGAAAAEVSSITPSTLVASSPPVSQVELTIAGRRVVGRVPLTALADLHAARGAGPLRLAGAARYGPYWTLTFNGSRAPLVVLADAVWVSGQAGGAGCDEAGPVLQVAG
jgi:hypothetical protein